MTEKILVIDDDTELLGLAQTWLRNAGYEPLIAEDGIEGLRQVYSARPSLVLVDIQMARMDGWEVCRRIRDMSDMPVIIVSVNGEKADLLRGFNLGVYDYITKPFHFPELIARVQAVLRRSSATWQQDNNSTFLPKFFNGCIVSLGVIFDVEIYTIKIGMQHQFMRESIFLASYF